MARSFAARGKLALAFWMLLAFRGLAHCEGSVEVFGTTNLGFAHTSDNPVGSVSKLTSGVESCSRLGCKRREEEGRGARAFFVLEKQNASQRASPLF